MRLNCYIRQHYFWLKIVLITADTIHTFDKDVLYCSIQIQLLGLMESVSPSTGTALPTRLSKPKLQTITSKSTSKRSLQLQDLMDDPDHSLKRKEGQGKMSARKDPHRSVKCENKESSKVRILEDAGVDECEDGDDDGNALTEPANEKVSNSSSAVDSHNRNVGSEHNNNINIYHNTHHGQNLATLALDDGNRLKKRINRSKENNDYKEHLDMDTRSSPPCSPIPSPERSSSVVDSVAGSSASVAVNSFLKFSIQNILQVSSNLYRQDYFIIHFENENKPYHSPIFKHHISGCWCCGPSMPSCRCILA